MHRLGASLAFLAAVSLSGCATFTTKITGSPRSGSEQLLVTGTADRAIECINFGPIADAKVYLDTATIQDDTPDSGWVIFAVRRTMARQGLLLVDDEDDAEVIVEASIAACGTDEKDRSVAPPAVSAVGGIPVPAAGGTPAAFCRKNRQDAVVKLALFAYDAKTRRLVWESGPVFRTESLDRRFVGINEYWRETTLPELETYPRR